MDLQTIKVIITKDGEVKIEVDGCTGNSCLDLSKNIEQALGGELLERQMKGEALQQETQVEHVKAKS